MLVKHRVQFLLMGGQACVLYGAAEFSRDTDIAILAEPANLAQLRAALNELQAECIAVPPLELSYLHRGHAVHFRCHDPETSGMRLDVMSRLRGVAPFAELYQRRATVELPEGLQVDLMAVEDLVQAKKTQRDKDWPMIRRLVDAHHATHRDEPNAERLVFWFRQGRSIPLLVELAASYPEAWQTQRQTRLLLALAVPGREGDLERALQDEEQQERAKDRAYWEPLKKELEQMRHALVAGRRHPTEANPMSSEPAIPTSNFIHAIIDEHNQNGRFGSRVQTRFPPEPNGYLHIGHAKSICLNFGTALKYGGKCNLRFDDTNPTKEEQEYVDSIQEDVKWLGFQWNNLFYASDYFQQLYEWAVQLINQGKAFVCDLTADEVREYRGTLTRPGKNSPYRDRTVAENLHLFERMKAGEFADGSRTLRARIDMASPNLNLRDPVMYRILHAHHHRTGDAWCIYPMYDWAHGQSDSIERITHSICTLEFENNRPLYDWFIKELGIYAPQQIEFARLSLTYTMMSKRKLLELVREGHVRGWDDPRMPTISGLRRRGYTPEAIRAFCERIGVSKFPGTIEMHWLEDSLREDLNKRAPRLLGVLRPLKVVIENYPEDHNEQLDAVNNPEDPSAGTRKLPFSRVLYIEQDDFREDPPKQFFRLAPGREVRLRWAYFVKCNSVVKDASGQVVELRCTYDPATRGGNAPDGRKVKGTIHWVSAAHALPVEVRLYDHLFVKPDPDDAPEGKDYQANLNPKSLEVVQALVEPSVKVAKPGDRFQFERLGYFCVDSKDSRPGQPVFNRAVTLADTWAKIEKGQKK
jgi:glutaminyl-tRNA synthetase